MADFVHLNVQTDYSFRRSFATVEELVKLADENDMKYLGITDDGNMFAVQEFYHECSRVGIKPIIGCKINAPNSDQLTLLAMSNEGYHNLMRLSTLQLTSGIKDGDIERYSNDLICLSGSYSNKMHNALIKGKYERAFEIASVYKTIFGDRFYIELMNHNTEKETSLLPLLVHLAEKLGVEYVATNDVRYCEKQESVLYDYFSKTPIETNEYYLKTPDEIETVFKDYPKALSTTLEIAKRCSFEIDFVGPDCPDFDIPQGYKDAFEYLRFLAFKGLRDKRLTESEYTERLEYELREFKKQDCVANYILIIWDYTKWAKSQGILCSPGWGSSPSSLLCYCLGITDIDPIKHGLVFERFFKECIIPYIAIDVDRARKNEIEKYIIQKYGEQRTAKVVSFGNLPTSDIWEFNKKVNDDNSLAPFIDAWKIRRIKDSCYSHSSGVAISRDDIVNHVPLFNFAHMNETIKTTQYAWENLEANGVVKYDVFGSPALTKLKETEEEIIKNHPDFSLDNIPENDSITLKMVVGGEYESLDILGDSEARKWLMKITPETWDEVADICSMCRPESDSLLPYYMKAKKGLYVPKSLDSCIDEILSSTHGVMIYQEQLMQIIHEFSGMRMHKVNSMRKMLQKRNNDAYSVLSFYEGAQALGHSRGQISKVYSFLWEMAPKLYCKCHMVGQMRIAYMKSYIAANYNLLVGENLFWQN